MKPYKPSNAPEALYPTAEQARNNTFTRAGAILLAVAASAAVLSGCGEKPADDVGNMTPPTSTVTTTATQPLTPGESMVEIDGDLAVDPEGYPTLQGAIATETTTTEPQLNPTGSVCVENTTESTAAPTEYPTTTVGTFYIPDEEDTTAAETPTTTAGGIRVTD